MLNKKLILMTLLLIAGAVAVTFVDSSRHTKDRDPRIGDTLLTDGYSEIDKIQLQKGESKLSLVRSGNDLWNIGSSAGFPVNASRIINLMDQLAKSKIIRLVADKQEQFDEFGLSSPTQIAMFSGDQQVVDLKLGDTRTGGGAYVALGGEYKGYLVDPAITTAVDETSWELKVLVDIPDDSIKSIQFTPVKKGEKPVSLSRESPESPFKVDSLDNEEAPIDSELAKLPAILKNLTYSRRFDIGNEEAKTASASQSSARINLFDGRVYTVLVGSVGVDKPKYFLEMKIDGEKPPSELADIERLQRIMQGWSFEISSFAASKFESARSKFVKSKSAG